MKNRICLLMLACLFSFSTLSAQGNFGEPTESPRTRSIKMAFFSPLVGHLGFGYEQLVQPGISIDGRFGIIGVGVDEVHNGNKGVYFGVGPKFLLGQDWHVEGMRQTHPLRGTYFKPELAFSIFGSNDATQEVNAYSGALLLNFGKQWVLADFISLDLSTGLGYAFGEHETRVNIPNTGTEVTTDVGGYFHSHAGGWDEFPIAFTSTFTIGIMIR